MTLVKSVKIVKKINLKSFEYSKKLDRFSLRNEKGQSFIYINNYVLNSVNSDKMDLFAANKSVVKNLVNSFNNSFAGLTKGFFFELSLRGIGFKCYFINNSKILLNLGYSHYTLYNFPNDVVVYIKKGKIFLYSLSKEILGQVVKDLKNLRIPDAYKAKGIVDPNQVFSLKEGKKR